MVTTRFQLLRIVLLIKTDTGGLLDRGDPIILGGLDPPRSNNPRLPGPLPGWMDPHHSSSHGRALDLRMTRVDLVAIHLCTDQVTLRSI